MHVPFGGTGGEEGAAPDRPSAEGHESLARRKTFDKDLITLALKDAHFPWAVEKMAEFAVEKALSGEGTPVPPTAASLMVR